MSKVWDSSQTSFDRKFWSPSCFNGEGEEGEEEALWYQPKLVELRKFLVPLLIQRYIQSLKFSTTFNNCLPVVEELLCGYLYSLHWCYAADDGKTENLFQVSCDSGRFLSFL